MQTRSSHDLEVEEGKQRNTLLNLLLIPLKDCEMSKLERKFAEIGRSPELKPLLRVTQGLVRFLISSRITADEALDLLCNTQE